MSNSSRKPTLDPRSHEFLVTFAELERSPNDEENHRKTIGKWWFNGI